MNCPAREMLSGASHGSFRILPRYMSMERGDLLDSSAMRLAGNLSAGRFVGFSVICPTGKPPAGQNADSSGFASLQRRLAKRKAGFFRD